MTVNVDKNPLEIQIKRGYMALEDHDWTSANSFFEEALNIDYESSEAYIGKLLARDKKPDLASWVAMQKDKYKYASQETLYACDEDTDYIEKIIQANVVDGYLDAQSIHKAFDFDRSYHSELSFRKEQRQTQLKELEEDRLLYRARQHAKGAYGKQVEDGISEIKAVLDQRVSNAEAEDNSNINRIKEEYAKHLEEADKKVVELNQDAHKRQEEDYQNAAALLNKAKDVPDFQKAIEALNAMNGYKDSAELAEKASQLKAIDEDYNKASGLMESNSIVELNNAVSILNKNQDWKDSKEKIQACNNKIASLKRAQEKQKKTRITIGAIIALVIVAVLGYTQFILPGQKYNEAIALMDDGKYEEALKAFSDIGGYKDSSTKKEECFKKVFGFDYPEVGTTINFGTYEQDSDKSNGEEEIEWIVLANEGYRVLLTSKYALDCQPYNIREEDVTWETCTLRDWLNNEFYEAAFSTKEQKVIATTNVTANKDADKDKVFLLSINEAEKYFASDEDRQLQPTEYVKDKGVDFGSNYGTSTWWLRSPGSSSSDAADVSIFGDIWRDGDDVNYDDIAVRPALWLGIE